jgi:hypothetical protein
LVLTLESPFAAAAFSLKMVQRVAFIRVARHFYQQLYDHEAAHA